ncbi:Dual specificity protein phosphatase 23 [Grifola frondosa]|uniref:Dual specificity protein phosphatase 23 n=1 Tax=Grifola frondosa TaxID=5627 RepID=A0A1C7LV85_GRIFR|nr:Dual specificity protein phosphatase 23 [Grifola frondosa]
MDLVMRLLDDADNLPMLIHCGGGKGRAGTVAACYLVAYGFAKPQPNRREPRMTAKEAISALRAIRPGSIETEQQEAFISKYYSTIWKRQSVVPVLALEPPPCPLMIEGTLATDSDLFILVGLPGSGKSYFSRALLARNPRSWTHISQDDTGSRSACETAIGNGRRHDRILLDRCNTSLDDRKEWLRLSAHWASAPVCVWFDYECEVCTSRAQNRAAHPTLPPATEYETQLNRCRGRLLPILTARGRG